MIVDAHINLALAGEQTQAGQFLNAEKENNSQLSTLNSLLTEKVAVQLNAERLKLIDDISRLILELKNQFPELAQNLSKAREGISANQENIQVKNLLNLLGTIQQNLNAFTEKSLPAEKLVLADTIKNLVAEAIKILQPSQEIPPENKLILALYKNDFGSVIAAALQIVSQNTRTAQTPQAPQTAQITQTPQAPQTAQITQPVQVLQNTQPAQPAQITQPIQVTQTPQAPQPVKITQPVQVSQNTQPAQPAQITQPVQVSQNTQPSQPVQITQPVQVLQNTQPSQPVQITQPVQVLQNTQPSQPIQTPQPAQIPQITQPVQVTQTPQAPQTAQPVQITQPMQITQPAQTPQNTQPVQITQTMQNTYNMQNTQPVQPAQIMRAAISLPTFQVISDALQELKVLGMPKELQNAPLKELEAVVLQKTGIEVPKDLAKNLSIAFSEKPVFAEVNLKTEISAPTANPVRIQITPLTIQTDEPKKTPPTFEIPLPKNFSVQQVSANIPQSTVQNSPQKIELAFSLYQITGQPSESKFILQPWIASTPIPKEERDFWLKTDLPLTQQTLNVRDTVLSFGKLPENPDVVKLFASGIHELSLQTEQGANVSKAQENLLWRLVTSDQWPTEKPLPPQITQTLLKYQPLGNYEGDIFKNLPEPIKRELLQELPAGKTWQPETLQKAVEKILEKYVEQQPSTANPNEHASKAHEEIKNVLQNLKEQIQWTRIDQDTRPQNDKENVFYFMHEGELQKGRLKIKDERKGGSKNRKESSISFSIETKTKNLGKVHADLILSKNILNIRLQDEIGTAKEAVKEERETLAKELADIGISLGELVYGKMPKIQILPIAEKKEKPSIGLDVKA